MRAVLIGASLAVLLSAAVVTAAVLRVPPFSAVGRDLGHEGVVVALVLPDVNGTNVVRLVDVYQPAGSGWEVRSVDPTQSALVPGTSGSTVADAFSFGGGRGLVEAVGAHGLTAAKHWVVVDEATFVALLASRTPTLTVPATMEVFDGARLYSYPQGLVSVPAAEMREVADGAAYLSAGDRMLVLAQLGDVLRAGLVSGTLAQRSGVSTDLTVQAFETWLRSAAKATRVTGR